MSENVPCHHCNQTGFADKIDRGFYIRTSLFCAYCGGTGWLKGDGERSWFKRKYRSFRGFLSHVNFLFWST